MRPARLLSVVVATLVPCAAWAQGNPVGPEFRVNTYTTADQIYGSVTSDGAGNFVSTNGTLLSLTGGSVMTLRTLLATSGTDAVTMTSATPAGPMFFWAPA